jgi:hypothetical protein
MKRVLPATHLDNDTGVLGGETVPQHALNKEADGLQVCEELERLRKVYPRQAEQLGLTCQLKIGSR